MHRRTRGTGGEWGVRLGRYELIEPLGVGGMAEIFKARALGPAGFEREVVIKRILSTHGHDAEFVRMFEDEARILGKLHHPNVVQVYDFGDADGLLFLALEFVDGPSLSRVLRTLRAANRRMPPAITAFVARDVCRALDYVHNLEDSAGNRLDVIHRDVTPSNIVLASTGCVKLLDFGVATFRAAAQISKAGTVKGKPAYLAPEQLEGKQIDGRVDLFALGVVMHEMLSLQHLFAGDSDLGTVKKIMEMKIPSPAAKRDDVPATLEAIVMRALERDRRRRFATAAEMAKALDDVVIASKLHLDEVTAFIREIDELSRLSAVRPVSAPPRAVRRVRARIARPEAAKPESEKPESEKPESEKPESQKPESEKPEPERPATFEVTRDEQAVTRREGGFALGLKNTGRVLATRPRAAFALGLVLAALGLGTAFRLRANASERNATADAQTASVVGSGR